MNTVQHILLNNSTLTAAIFIGLIIAAPSACPGLADARPAPSILRTQVERTLAGDWRLQDLNLQVRVSDGQVTLEGCASSYFQKYHAGQLCKQIRGVRRVRNHITVRLIPFTDKEITGAVHRRLSHEVLLRGRNLTVSVNNRVVTLSGRVGSWFQKSRAESSTRKVPSVLRVDNKLQVRPAPIHDERRSDTQINEELLARLDRDRHLDGLKLFVEVEDGVARLEGVVESWFQKERVVHHARSVSGVREIDNRLVVTDYR